MGLVNNSSIEITMGKIPIYYGRLVRWPSAFRGDEVTTGRSVRFGSQFDRRNLMEAETFLEGLGLHVIKATTIPPTGTRLLNPPPVENLPKHLP